MDNKTDKKLGAILLDTRSIQKYVFGCNKLQTNIGASSIVDRIFTEEMVHVLEKSKLTLPDTPWQDYTRKKEKEPNLPDLQILDNNTIEAEIAYIGGGNMLILVRPKESDVLECCKQLVRTWSKNVLLAAPGLKTGVAITDEMDIEPKNFKTSLDKLYGQLKVHQNTILPQVDLPYTGLTHECDLSGKVANYFSTTYDRWVSEEVHAKRLGFKEAEKIIYNLYNQECDDHLPAKGDDEFVFAKELDKIGYIKGQESYICVIHIDGNNMGVKFSSCQDMQERRALSLRVAEIVQEGFKELVNQIITEYEAYEPYLQLQRDKDNRIILPFRPIIIGGDDVTFICAGRLGLLYAQRFIANVSEKDMLNDRLYNAINKDLEGEGKKVSQKMSCCGGIAIVPAKYPFYRAYELAEQLCGSAKKQSRQKDTSLIDFAVLHGQMPPQLNQLEQQTYEAPEGYLHLGPYTIAGEGKAGQYWGNLVSSYFDLYGNPQEETKGVPETKIKDLRAVLHSNAHMQELFLEHCPEMKDILVREMKKERPTAKDLWLAKAGQRVTPWMDVIEIEKFVIPELLVGQSEGKKAKL